MLNKIILASKSKVRKDILDKNNIQSIVEPSNVDEDIVKLSLLKENASPEIISKNLAELKANKVSAKKQSKIVLGADSVIDLNGELRYRMKIFTLTTSIKSRGKVEIYLAV
jgi:septum formation protein